MIFLGSISYLQPICWQRLIHRPHSLDLRLLEFWLSIEAFLIYAIAQSTKAALRDLHDFMSSFPLRSNHFGLICYSAKFKASGSIIKRDQSVKFVAIVPLNSFAILLQNGHL